jgi:hypothetical protein
MTGESIALIISALGVAIAAIITAVRTGRAVKRVEEQVGAVHHTIGEIDKAVNGKAPGEQSIAGQIDDLHKELPASILAAAPEPALEAGIKPLVQLLVADLLERKAAGVPDKGDHLV